MARVHTHYDNLKVARDAPPEVIRAAYKTLSQKHHPDRNGNSKEAIRIIQLINTAYEVLSDPVRRQEHDAWISRMEKGEGQGSKPEIRSREPRQHAPTAQGSQRNGTARRSRRKTNPLTRLADQIGRFWERLRRRFAAKSAHKA